MSEPFGFVQQLGTAGPVDDPVLLASEAALALGGNFDYETPELDVRAYNSVQVNMNLLNGTMLTSDLITVQLTFWTNDNVGGVNDRVIFRDEYLVFKTTPTGPLKITFPVLGPRMTLRVVDENTVNRTAELSYKLFGSYRIMPARFISEDTPYIVGVNLAAAAADSRAAKLFHGRAKAHLLSGAGGGATLTLAWANFPNQTETLVAAAANQRVEKEIIAPRRQCWVTLTNNGAGASLCRAWITREIQAY